MQCPPLTSTSRGLRTDAAMDPATQANRSLDAGNLDGAAVWRQIVAAIVELQRREPGGQVQ